MSSVFDQIASVITRESGVRLGPTQYNVLQSALGRVAPGIDPASFVRCASEPGGRELMTRLIEEITVQETSFLRDRHQLETIDWKLLQEQARASGSETIRVWSAACATGEEAYSLALLACDAFASKAPPVRILATDISAAALAHAQRGSYGLRTVRTLDRSLRTRYFDQDGDRLVVGEQLRRLVTFAHHNLIRDPFPPMGEPRFHLILCRNVLIYFDRETAERVVASLERALHPPGTLVLGAPDVLCVSGLRTVAQAPCAAPAPERPPAFRPLRRPLGRVPEAPPAERLERVLGAADAGKSAEAIREASELLAQDPLNAEAYFLRGLVQLEAGDAPAAVKSLRGALYLFPHFGPAAFKLGRAYEALGDRVAARRAYEQALRTIEHGHDDHDPILDQVGLGDVAAACEARIVALR